MDASRDAAATVAASTSAGVAAAPAAADRNAVLVLLLRVTLAFAAALLLFLADDGSAGARFGRRAAGGSPSGTLLDASATAAAAAQAAPAPRFVVVTFGSMGPPYDEGINLQAARSKFMDLVGPHADEVRMFSPSDLRDDPWWAANFHVYPDTVEWVIQHNPGGNRIGYWKHKPLLLLRAMQSEPEGTLIMYMDVNVLKYPDLTAGVAEWRNVSAFVFDEIWPADIWLGYEDAGASRVKNFCKGYTVHNISAPRFADRIFERSLLVGNRILVRNTAALRRMFEEELLPLFTDDRLLANYPQDGTHAQLFWHTADQAVWNAFLFNRQYLGKLPRVWPKFEYIMRARWFSFHGLAPYEDEDWASFDAAEANRSGAAARAP